MAHENTSPTVAVDASKMRRPRDTPKRTASSDSAVSRDEHDLLRRKLRGLRSKASDDSVNCTPKNTSNRSLQDRDDQDRTGSSRSIKTHETAASALSATSGASSVSGGAGSFAGCDSTDFFPLDAAVGPSRGSLKTPQDCTRTVATVSTRSASVADSTAAGALSPRPRPSHNRGLSRRGRMTDRTSQANLLANSSHHVVNATTRTSLTEASEHSNGNLSTASTTALERLAQRNTTRGRARGLGGKKISTTRVVEPTLSPVVPANGAISPVPTKTPTKRLSSGGESQARMISAIPSPNLVPNINGGSERKSTSTASIQPGPSGGLNEKLNDVAFERQERLHRSLPSVESTHSQSSNVISNNSISTRGMNPTLSRMGSLTSRPGLRGRREASVVSRSTNQLNPSSHHSTGSAAHRASQAARNPSSQVQQPQKQALYQPTERDWAVLYNKHVEELERKDLEIAMKLSNRPNELYGDQGTGDDDEEEDSASLNGIELALEVSRREVRQTDNDDEDEMLQMVLEMSKNDELDTSFANASFPNGSFCIPGNESNISNANDCVSSPQASGFQVSASTLGSRGNHSYCNNEKDATNEDILNAINIPMRAQQAKDLDPDAQLERALQISSETPKGALSEEEELERVLQLSQQEDQQPKAQLAAMDEDEELLRVLRLSQQYHEEEKQKQQDLKDKKGDEDDELLRVLQLSQKEATDQEKERETMELVLQLSRQETTDGGLW